MCTEASPGSSIIAEQGKYSVACNLLHLCALKGGKFHEGTALYPSTV